MNEYDPATVSAELETIGLLPLAQRVAKLHSVPLLDVLSRKRTKSIARARGLLWATMRAMGMSTPELGRLFHRDHSTVVALTGQVPVDESTAMLTWLEGER